MLIKKLPRCDKSFFYTSFPLNTAWRKLLIRSFARCSFPDNKFKLFCYPQHPSIPISVSLLLFHSKLHIITHILLKQAIWYNWTTIIVQTAHACLWPWYIQWRWRLRPPSGSLPSISAGRHSRWGKNASQGLPRVTFAEISFCFVGHLCVFCEQVHYFVHGSFLL